MLPMAAPAMGSRLPLAFLSFHPALHSAEAPLDEYRLLQQQGENYFKPSSFAKSREVYLKARKLKLARNNASGSRFD